MATVFRRKSGKKYLVKYRGYDPKAGQLRWMTKTGTADKDSSKRLGAKWEAEARLRAEGVIDAKEVAYSEHEKEPLRKHLDDFTRHMEAKGDTPRHVAETVSRIRRVADHCGVEVLTDLDADAVAHYVTTVRTEDRNGERRTGARTINASLTALKSFTRWAVVTGRLRHDPLASVSKLNVDADRRHKRRALSDDELAWLFRAAPRSWTSRDRSGH